MKKKPVTRKIYSEQFPSLPLDVLVGRDFMIHASGGADYPAQGERMHDDKLIVLTYPTGRMYIVRTHAGRLDLSDTLRGAGGHERIMAITLDSPYPKENNPGTTSRNPDLSARVRKLKN